MKNWSLASRRDEQPLQPVGRPDGLAMIDREAKMGGAGLEIVLEAAHNRWQIALIGLNHLFPEQPGDLA